MSETVTPPVIVVQPEGVEIPAGIVDLAGFRRWVHSETFPERGRIDWLNGRMEVDMSPEDLNTHGSPKSAIAVRLGALIQDRRLGMVFIDRARLTVPAADLSVEPDVLVLLRATLRAGRAQLVPRASGAPGRFIEIEGAPDLVVECGCDSSKRKDTVALRAAYLAAGVREYWLVDGRPDPPRFELLALRAGAYVPAGADREGFVPSEVLAATVRFVRETEADGLVFFRLDVRPGPGPDAERPTA